MPRVPILPASMDTCFDAGILKLPHGQRPAKRHASNPCSSDSYRRKPGAWSVCVRRVPHVFHFWPASMRRRRVEALTHRLKIRQSRSAETHKAGRRPSCGLGRTFRAGPCATRRPSRLPIRPSTCIPDVHPRCRRGLRLCWRPPTAELQRFPRPPTAALCLQGRAARKSGARYDRN